MLFSKDDVANFINKNFEPVWESVRPVPIVRIDFGNGTVVTRTLHGNIATYVCSAEGQVLDVAAGIYAPTVFLQRLDQFRLLANYADQLGKEKRGERVKDYHRSQAASFQKNQAPAEFRNVANMSKVAIEGGIKAMLVPGQLVKGPSPATTKSPQVEELKSEEDLANWKVLAEDTAINESLRRQQVHELLAETGAVKPQQITKKIYKDILHADLDDPYLGLGPTLFASYPFRDDGSSRK